MPDPLAVLLLPERLEAFALAEHARDLLRAPQVIALEPPRVSWARLARLPESLALHTAMRQAKRLKLPGQARVIILYDPLQTMMGLGLIARYPGADLWYVRSGAESSESSDADPKLAERVVELDTLARRRASLEISLEDLAPLPPARTWFEANDPLWERLEELGIAHFAA
ncbi:MAG TPA: hypothetical protein VG295_15205 [Solirubrobacteraceae bacterium]|jgi:hypothetical protein|nr:hypothetical protein [Solirubrobacteraceae bacterium]